MLGKVPQVQQDTDKQTASTDIPAAPKVTRKPHTTGAATNGPNTNGSTTFADNGNIKSDLSTAAHNQFNPSTTATTVS